MQCSDDSFTHKYTYCPKHYAFHQYLANWLLVMNLTVLAQIWHTSGLVLAMWWLPITNPIASQSCQASTGLVAGHIWFAITSVLLNQWAKMNQPRSGNQYWASWDIQCDQLWPSNGSDGKCLLGKYCLIRNLYRQWETGVSFCMLKFALVTLHSKQVIITPFTLICLTVMIKACRGKNVKFTGHHQVINGVKLIVWLHTGCGLRGERNHRRVHHPLCPPRCRTLAAC